MIRKTSAVCVCVLMQQGSKLVCSRGGRYPSPPRETERKKERNAMSTVTETRRKEEKKEEVKNKRHNLNVQNEGGEYKEEENRKKEQKVQGRNKKRIKYDQRAEV